MRPATLPRLRGRAQFQGHYARSIRIYGHAEHHMLEMADMLSKGIIAQFPGKC